MNSAALKMSDRRERRDRWLLAAILALALLARLAFVLLIPQAENASGDSAEFDLLARNLLAGHGLSYQEPWLLSARRTPLYPTLLAGTYSLFGAGVTLPLLLLQALIDTATTALVTWLAGRAWNDRRVGLLAGLAWALYLPGAQLAGRLLADSLFTFLLVAGFSLFAVARRRPWLALATGVTLGLANLARPTGLPLPLALAGLLVWQGSEGGGRRSGVGGRRSEVRGRRSTGSGWMGAFLLVLGAALVLAPWTVRNTQVFGEFLPGSTLVGFNFYQTHYNLDQPDYWDLPGVPATMQALKADLRAEGIEPNDLDEAAFFGQGTRLGLTMVRRYPGRFVSLSGRRMLQLWFNLGFGGRPSPATWIFAAGNAFLLLLALLAEWRFWRRRPWPQPQLTVHLSALIVLAYFTASHAALIAAGRYIIPAIPFLVVLAAGVVQPLLPDEAEGETTDEHGSEFGFIRK